MYVCIFIHKYTHIYTCIYKKRGQKKRKRWWGEKKKKVRKSLDEAPQYCLGSTLSFELLLAGF